jgi:hypothetical protein
VTDVPPVDPLEFLAELERGYPPGYSPADVYRDFRKVLLDDEAGRRVLGMLMRWTHPNAMSLVLAPDDKLRWQAAPQTIEQVAFREGERHVGIQILAVLATAPKG